MQITKISSNNKQNIRIRTQTRSKSNQKQSQIEKTHKKIINFNNQNNTSVEKTNLNKNTRTSILQNQKQINRPFSPFLQKKVKKLLTLSTKSNNYSSPLKNNDFKQNLLQQKGQSQNQQRKSVISHFLMKDQQNKKDGQSFTTLITQDSQQSQLQDVRKSKQQNRKWRQNSKTNYNGIFYNNQYKKMLSDFKLNWFSIQTQFSFSIQNHQQTTCNAQTQTYNTTMQDKYFNQYAKYRQLKVNSFNQLQQKQQKIKQILQSTADFQKNYSHLLSSVKDGPKNDRQKRVFQLSKDLHIHQIILKQSFLKIHDLANKFQQYIQTTLNPHKQKKLIFISSIQNYIKEALLDIKHSNTRQYSKNHQHSNTRQYSNFSQYPNTSQLNKTQQLLQKTIKEVISLKQFVIHEGNCGMKLFKIYNDQVLQLQRKKNQFCNLSYQNKVLQYHLIKQIQKIPTLMITLFGYNQEEAQSAIQWDNVEQLQQRFNQFMKIKCEECYHMKKKIKYMQFYNQKIQPVFKSLQWLIRDCSQNQTCLNAI